MDYTAAACGSRFARLLASYAEAVKRQLEIRSSNLTLVAAGSHNSERAGAQRPRQIRHYAQHGGLEK